MIFLWICNVIIWETSFWPLVQLRRDLTQLRLNVFDSGWKLILPLVFRSFWCFCSALASLIGGEGEEFINKGISQLIPRSNRFSQKFNQPFWSITTQREWEQPMMDGLLRYILEYELAAHIQKVPCMVIRVLIWFPTIETFYLQRMNIVVATWSTEFPSAGSRRIAPTLPTILSVVLLTFAMLSRLTISLCDLTFEPTMLPTTLIFSHSN